MKKLFLIISFSSVLFIAGCASHPVVHPGSLKKNEQVWGYALAAENIFPVVWFRKGLDQNTELGYRLGLPIYGTGIDLSRERSTQTCGTRGSSLETKPPTDTHPLNSDMNFKMSTNRDKTR